MVYNSRHPSLRDNSAPGKLKITAMAAPNVLVTGSAGHLGCAAMLDLPSHGYTPIGIDILASDTTTEVGSITDRAFIDSVLERHPSIRHILHAATLHKPHVESHTKADFVDVNIHGTLTLLEAAQRLGARIDAFVFVSTTSAFGRALSPAAGQPAAWIDEDVAPVPKNIYGVTKVAAEDLCRLAHAQTGLPVVVLRTSRFFPEADDDAARRAALPDPANLQLLELAHRRVDVADVVGAAAAALGRARALGWGRYVVSAPPPFARDDAETLRRLGAGEDAAAACAEAVPGLADAVRRSPGWALLPRLDRVYDPARARRDLGWRPRFTIQRAVDCVNRGEEWRSELAVRVGTKGYHAVSTGVYTVR